MKIAMVSEDDGPGRWDVHAADLAAALVALGHEVTVHTCPEAAATTPGQEPYLGDFVDSLRSEWAHARPDVVHAHHWQPGLAALLAVRPAGVPVVQSFHGFGRRPDVERLVGREAAVVVAGCEDELLRLAAAGVPRPRMVVVPRGVDVELFQPQGEPARRRVKRIVARAGDGVEDVVAALPWLPDAELLITGPFPADEAKRLGRRARELGVHERIRSAGPVAHENLPALLRSADVVACVPRQPVWDAWPLEAMACGVAVVATSVSGLTDAVTDGVTGVLVPPGEVKTLVKNLRVVLEDATLRTSCGIAAVDRVQARHTWPDVARGLERLYRRVLEPPAVVKRGRRVAG
ncbi:glycosyl transferase [Lentzea pudingi]|uniref:Glycosyl transferase n=1 Tax=Lentzea pudingi TaxID=1789439 RepID=A0ABQ2HC66_9PSEU|nr:glycosyltransferase [Lentzea pudingi]GGM75012.1 glycosyl transferase [Lentzea pudingi]